MPKQISNKIKIYSFAFSIGVVFFHVCPTPEEYLWSNNKIIYWCCCRLNHFLANVGTYANIYFVFMSAFLLYRDLNIKNVKTKIISRIKSVFIPLVLWNLIYALPFAIIRGEKFTVWDILFSRYCVPMWFLTALLVYLLLLPTIELAVHYIFAGGVVCVLVFVVSDYLTKRVTELQVLGEYSAELSRYITYLPIYMLGAYVAKHFKEKFYDERIVGCIYGRILLVIGLLLPFICDLLGKSSFTASIAFVGCTWLICPKTHFNNIKYRFIGDSFGIFAFHTGIWIVVITVFVKMGIYLENMKFNIALYLLLRCVCVTVFVALSLMFTEIIRRIFPQVYNILFGKRNCKE